MVCVTLRWRKPDSNLRSRITRPSLNHPSRIRRNMQRSAALRGLEDGPAALRIGGESNANFLVG